MATPAMRLISEQYLENERRATYKSEFLNGEIVAMAGASLRHAQLQSHLLVRLAAGVGKRSCQVLASDMRVRAGAGRTYAYPDVVVVCGTPELADDDYGDTLLNPVVLIEILSPATERYDRGLKFEHYRAIPSLSEYLLFDQQRCHAEHYTRFEMPAWTLREYPEANSVVRIAALGIEFPLGEIYAGMKLPAE